MPSAIHAMGRAIAKISDIPTPQQPKTTYTVGTISGGTSVNTIAAEATMLIDIRSISPEQLLKTEEEILAYVKEAAADENQHWKSDALTVEITRVGDRPAGSQPSDAIIVQAALAAAEAMSLEPQLSPPSSTEIGRAHV